MVAAISPRLPYSATLGTVCFAEPRKGSVGLILDGLQSRNLFEVGFASRMLPKVAEYSNLGLKDAIPLGLPAFTSKLDACLISKLDGLLCASYCFVAFRKSPNARSHHYRQLAPTNR